ncbi:MAG: rhomboid family intramembrane serine protease [Desulfurococcales archaeon]|nr:rhomboid family intramembrane serine protease [Desulfurococcales archaeon]
MFRRLPIATLSLIIINVFVYIATLVSPDLLLPYARTDNDLYRLLGAIPIAIVHGENLWTLFTSMFLHGDFYHLFGNMLFLYFFGGPVENAMGSKRFILFYILSGLSAHLFHILSISLIPSSYLLTNYSYNPWAIPTIGASGAISGVMGAYLLYYPRARLSLVYFIAVIPLFVTLPAWAYLLLWFAMQLAMGLMVLIGISYSSIAFWAHIGGFATGLALAPYFLHPKIKRFIRIKRLAEEHGLLLTPDGIYQFIEEEEE